MPSTMTLSEYIKDSGRTQRELARAFGISDSYMSELVAGKKQPSLRLAMEICAESEGKIDASALLLGEA